MAKFFLMLLTVPLATAGVAAPAFAQDDTRSITVSYDDLNLSSERGRERLTTRVKMAVRKVCGLPGRATPNPSTRPWSTAAARASPTRARWSSPRPDQPGCMLIPKSGHALAAWPLFLVG